MENGCATNKTYIDKDKFLEAVEYILDEFKTEIEGEKEDYLKNGRTN